METTLITDNHYFPCIAWYSALFHFSYVKIEACENYRKTGFRNRCVVAGSNGPITLSVPVEGGRDFRGLYRDVRISNSDNWRVQHWRTITSCYAKAPFFEYYAAGVESLLNRQHSFLFDFNQDILHWLQQVLKLQVHLSMTSSFEPVYPAPAFADQRNKWLPNNYDAFVTPHYYQLFEDRIGFKNNLSILDLLFCEGPNACSILRAGL